MNRLKFCIAEQVLPASAPAQLKQGSRAFTTAAKSYLEEACTDMKYKLNILLEERTETNLPHHLESKLQSNNEQQQRSLKRKLQELCERSPWRHAGNASIVNLFFQKSHQNRKKKRCRYEYRLILGKMAAHLFNL